MQTKINTRFTIIPNALIFDNTISALAKCLYGYMNGKPDGWDFASRRIAEEMKEGKDAILKAMKELEDKGYLVRKKISKGRGQFEYKSILYSEPKLSRPKISDAITSDVKKERNNKTEETNILSKDNIENIRFLDKKKKERNNKTEETKLTKKEEYGKSEINNILRAISDVHGTIDGTQAEQRRFANSLIKKIEKIPGFNGDFYGFVYTICSSVNQYYIARTTSPKLLFYNLGSIMASIKKENLISNESETWK